MASGLVALLDDVAAIAKIAATSLDDMSAAAGKAGSKAMGVVIDDAAVTPGYAVGFTPDRELPIIGKIALGSLAELRGGEPGVEDAALRGPAGHDGGQAEAPGSMLAHGSESTKPAAIDSRGPGGAPYDSSHRRPSRHQRRASGRTATARQRRAH